MARLNGVSKLLNKKDAKIKYLEGKVVQLQQNLHLVNFSLEEKEKNKKLASEGIFVEHLIRLVKIFRIAQERFRLNSSKYEQIIMTICGLVRLRIGTYIL